MKATIALTNLQLSDQVLRSLITLIQGNSQLQQHITNHGIWFENLTTETVAAFKQLLRTLDYSTYDSTDTSVHLWVAQSWRLGGEYETQHQHQDLQDLRINRIRKSENLRDSV